VAAAGVRGVRPGPSAAARAEAAERGAVPVVPGRAGPGAEAVSGRPGPAGLGVHEAAAAAVDVAGPCRAAVRRLRPACLHAADVRPAALQQHPGRGRGHSGERAVVGAAASRGRALPAGGVPVVAVAGPPHSAGVLGWPLPCRGLLQEVAVEALLRATGLPAELVHHALTPLIHGDGVLVRSCALGGERGAGPQVGAGFRGGVAGACGGGGWAVASLCWGWRWCVGLGAVCGAGAWVGVGLRPACGVGCRGLCVWLLRGAV